MPLLCSYLCVTSVITILSMQNSTNNNNFVYDIKKDSIVSHSKSVSRFKVGEFFDI